MEIAAAAAHLPVPSQWVKRAMESFKMGRKTGCKTGLDRWMGGSVHLTLSLTSMVLVIGTNDS